MAISFSDFYKKTERNLNLVDGLIYSDITHQTKLLFDLSIYMSKLAKKYGMEIESCAEHVDLSHCGIAHGKCIAHVLIKKLFGLTLMAERYWSAR